MYYFPEEIEKLTGLNASDFSKPGFYLERIHRHDKVIFQQFVNALITNKMNTLKYRFKCSNNEYVWVYDIITQVANNDESESIQVSGVIEWDIERVTPKFLFDDEKSRSLFNASNSAILILDIATFELIDFNNAALHIFNCKNREEFFDSSIAMNKENFQDGFLVIADSIKQAKQGKESQFITRMQRFSGDFFYADIVFRLLTLDDKQYAMAVITDVTDRVDAEKLADYRFTLEKLVYEISSNFINVSSFEVDSQIEKSFEKVCDFIQTDSIYIYIYRDLKQEIELSHYWIRDQQELDPGYKVISYHANDIHYHTMHEEKIVKINSVSQAVNFKSRIVKTVGKFAYPVLLQTALSYQGNVIGFIGTGKKDGVRFWTEDDVQLLQMLGEIYVLALQRKEAVKVLLEGERTYREIYNATNDAMLVIDRNDHSIIDVNQAFNEMFGYSFAEYPEIELIEIHSNQPGYNQSDFINIIQNASDSVSNVEWYAKDKNGAFFWTDLTVKRAEIHGGECILCIFRDVSERRKSEFLLRNSEDRFRSIVQQLSDIVFILDDSGIIIYVTPSAENILGYSSDELIGTMFRKLLLAISIQNFDEYYTKVLGGETKTKLEDVLLKTKHEEQVLVELIGNNMLHHSAVNGVVITCSDITDRRNTEKKILDAVIRTEEHEREMFAKNLHDDLGPLLSSLKMYITLLSGLQEGEKRDFVYSQVEEIMKEAIVTTKNVSNDLSPHVLTNYGLASAIETFAKKITHDIKIDFAHDISEVRFDPSIESSLYRITKELINNSLKHSDGNLISIKIKEKEQDLIFKYSDNGKKFSLKKIEEYQRKGMGLANIISRSKTLNSSYNFYVSKPGGFGFEMRVPLI